MADKRGTITMLSDTNKSSAATKANFEEAIVNMIDWQQFAEDMKVVKPEKRVDAYLKLLEFAVGKKQSVSSESVDRVRDSAEEFVDQMINGGKPD
jgi:hypothetical protein